MSDDFDKDKPQDDNVINFPGNNDKHITITEYTTHPLESVFDIEPGTTLTEYTERTPLELTEYEPYDNKDKEIEEQIQEVYSLALNSYDSVTDNVDGLEPKYVARAHEVAAGYLNIALQAAREKKELKQTKDKLEKMTKVQKGGNTTNILVSHSDILEMVRDMKIPSYDDYLEGEVIEPDPPT